MRKSGWSSVFPLGQYAVAKSRPATRTRSSRAPSASRPGRPTVSASAGCRLSTATPFQPFSPWTTA